MLLPFVTSAERQVVRRRIDKLFAVLLANNLLSVCKIATVHTKKNKK